MRLNKYNKSETQPTPMMNLGYSMTTDPTIKKNQAPIPRIDNDTLASMKFAEPIKQYQVKQSAMFNDSQKTQSRSPRTIQQNVSYNVTFQTQTHIKFGQTLCCMGSLQELGAWKEFKHHMKWTEGDNWVSVSPLITDAFYFQYKYAILEKEGTERVSWEKGVDKIADLEIMPDAREFGNQAGCCNDLYSIQEQFQKQKGTGGVKFVHYNDQWESFNVAYTLAHPIEEFGEDFTLDSIKLGKIKMHKLPRELEWMDVKYGKNMQPYQCSMKIPNITNTNCGQFDNSALQEYYYHFIKQNQSGTIVERGPRRQLNIQNPEDYKGYLGSKQSNLWLNTDKVWIVNGWVHKADGNFINNFFFNQVHSMNIFIGSYPIHEQEVHRLQQTGITAILNIQNNQDFVNTGTSPDKMSHFYRNKGINVVVNQNVCDYTEPEYADHLFKAALALHDLHDIKKHKVYIHDTCGVSRVSTLILCYMALFCKSEKWNNIPAMAQNLKIQHPLSNPNIPMVQTVMDNNQDFLSKHKYDHEKELLRQQREQDEIERQAQLRAAQNEAERLRLKRQAEIEAEKLRLQRIQFEDEERKRLQKAEDEEAERLRLQKLRDQRDKLEKQKLHDEENQQALKKKTAEDEAKAERLRLQKLRDQRDKHEKQKLADEENQQALKKKNDLDAANREAEKIRLKQEAELKEEQIRVQKLTLETQREQTRIKKDQQESDEAERLRNIKIQKDEAERKKKEQEDEDERERLRILKLTQIQETERLRLIEVARQETVKLSLERQAIESESLLRQQQRLEVEETERVELKKQAEEEAQKLLYRLKTIEEEEAERLRKKRIAEFEFQEQTKKIKSLMDQEIASRLKQKMQTSMKGAIGGKNMAAMFTKSASPGKEPVQMKPLVVKSKRPPTVIQEQHDPQYSVDQYQTQMDATYDQPAFGDMDLMGISEAELDQQCDDLFLDVPVKFKARKQNELDHQISYFIRELNFLIPIIHIKNDLFLIGSEKLSVMLTNSKVMLRVGGGWKKFEEHLVSHQRYYQRKLVIHMIKSGESLEWVIDAIITNKKIPNLQKQAQDALQQEQKFSKMNQHHKSPRSPSTNRSSNYQMNSNSGKRNLTPGRVSFRNTSPYSMTKTVNMS